MQDGSDRTRDYLELWQQMTTGFLANNRQFFDKYIDLQKRLIEQQNTYLRDLGAAEEALPQLAKIAMASYLNILAFQREQRALSADAHALANELYLRFLTMLSETAKGTSSDAEK